MKRRLFFLASFIVFLGSSGLAEDVAPAFNKGKQIETTMAPTDVQLENGVDFRLAARSAATLYDDHAVLSNGAVRISHFDKYPLEVSGLSIQADDSETEAVVRATPATVEIASIGGPVRVSDLGATTTVVTSGTKIAFQNSGASAGTQSGATAGNPNAPSPSTTGAAPTSAPTHPMNAKKAILWTAAVCAVAAIIIGSIAAGEGKSPF